jgi:hypothetical protein
MEDNEIGGIYAITVKHHENHWIVMRTSYTESMEKHLEERYGKECKERLFAYLTFISDVMEKSDQNWEQKLFSAKNADKTAILNAEMIGKTIVGVKQVGNIVKITLENGQEYIF